MVTIKELIEINEIKSKTITDLICSENTKEEEKETLLACRRFIRGFISELKELDKTHEEFKKALLERIESR